VRHNYISFRHGTRDVGPETSVGRKLDAAIGRGSLEKFEHVRLTVDADQLARWWEERESCHPTTTTDIENHATVWHRLSCPPVRTRRFEPDGSNVPGAGAANISGVKTNGSLGAASRV